MPSAQVSDPLQDIQITEFDPNRIVADGYISYEGTRYKNIKPTLVTWRVIRGDNSRPKSNEIVVEASPMNATQDSI